MNQNEQSVATSAAIRQTTIKQANSPYRRKAENTMAATVDGGRQALTCIPRNVCVHRTNQSLGSSNNH